MNQLEQFSHLPYSHHAYGIESDQDIIAQTKSVIPKDECSYIFDRHYDSFKIDDARAIKSLQAEKTEKAAVFIISFTVINNEAQNALLKVLEEPTANTYFILIFPNAKKLLPTLQSRLSLVHVDITEGNDTERKLPVSSFITMSLQERFDTIKELTDKKNTDALSKSDMLLFLNDLERYLNEQSVKQADVFDVVFRARSYLNANGASHKMILDMIAMHV
ncbi:hypothetical protein KC866_03115 [Patescibacteria group bacterium]|nr:hypothetical protein [Patescibacteria group bacterium]